jgi:hypothetical protein
MATRKGSNVVLRLNIGVFTDSFQVDTSKDHIQWYPCHRFVVVQPAFTLGEHSEGLGDTKCRSAELKFPFEIKACKVKPSALTIRSDLDFHIPDATVPSVLISTYEIQD